MMNMLTLVPKSKPEMAYPPSEVCTTDVLKSPDIYIDESSLDHRTVPSVSIFVRIQGPASLSPDTIYPPSVVCATSGFIPPGIFASIVDHSSMPSVSSFIRYVPVPKLSVLPITIYPPSVVCCAEVAKSTDIPPKVFSNSTFWAVVVKPIHKKKGSKNKFLIMLFV